MTRAHLDERGDTLVEILVALAVLAIGVVALVGGLTTNVTATVVNREQAQAESVLASAAEYVKALDTATLPFACPGSTPVAVSTTAVPRDPDYAVTYGPAQAVDGLPCTELVGIPVSVVGNGYSLSVTVVRRP